MIKANELRLGNLVYYGESVREITLICNSPQQPGKIGVDNLITRLDIIKPIPLTPEILEMAGFKDMPHFTIGRIMNKDIGRGRVISISSVGTPNEMICINEEEPPTVKSIIVARNFDYDGRTYLHQLQNLYHSLTGEELEIDFKTYKELICEPHQEQTTPTSKKSKNFNSIPEDQVREMPIHHADIKINMVEMAEKLYKDILFQILGRDAGEEDFKKVTLVRNDSHPDYEWFTFEGKTYGVVQTIYPSVMQKDKVIKMVFTPGEEFQFTHFTKCGAITSSIKKPE